MITPEYCQLMAQHNAHQNKGVRAVVEAINVDELTKDRGAFFGSILKTLNHLLWGDQLWLNRFGFCDKPAHMETRGVDIAPTIAVWGAERFRIDGTFTEWARNLKALDLTGDIVWHSDVTGGDYTVSKARCVMNVFHHQTHHRGQVHAMLTAAGHKLPETDFLFLEINS